MNQKRVSLRHIADATGLSTCTVSKVLGNAPGSIVSARSREAILDAARRLGYRPNRNARAFTTGRLDCVGLAIDTAPLTAWRSRATASLLMETLLGASERLAELGHTALLSVSAETGPDESLRREYLSEQRVDGLITFFNISDALLADLTQHGIPWVCAAHTRPARETHGVGADVYPAILRAVQRLKELGHRRVAYVGYAQDAPPERMVERQFLYWSLLEQHGIEVDRSFAAPAVDEADSYVVTRGMAERKDLPSCLIYHCDHFAITGLRALLDAGRRVPQDVSVVGYDDATYTASSLVPLSTIRIPRRGIGRMAADLVVERKQGSGDRPASVALAAEWVERASVGPAA